ncbi:MAG TPA: hypothetical protein EYH40_03170 [Desulfurococcales archaeon]|nr:hypothetical protein [Desulfurococcales archaeon]
MRNIFYDPRARESLALMLRSLGFYVHLHSYEYLVMKNGKIIATIYLHPSLNEIVINVYKFNPEAETYSNIIVEAIRRIDKGGNRIHVRRVPVHGDKV